MHNFFKINIETQEVIKDEKILNNLIKKSQKGDKKSEAIVLESNLKLVLKILRKFKIPPNQEDDIFQVGSIGLLKAIKNFDTERNIKFSTYAFPMIYGEIQRYLRENNILKISRMIQERNKEIMNFREEYLTKNFKEPNYIQIRKATGFSFEEIDIALKSKIKLGSLEQNIKNDKINENKATIKDFLADEKDLIKEWDNKESIEKAFTILKNREKEVIIMRFYENKTQKEISEKMKVSQAHVSRIEKLALKKMKEFI